LLSDLAGVEGFLAGVPQSQQADGSDEEQTRFDKEFGAIEPIHRGIFQAGIGEETVPEERASSEINGETKGFP